MDIEKKRRNDTEQTRIGLGIGADTYTTGSSGKHPWIVILDLGKPRYRNGQDAHQGGRRKQYVLCTATENKDACMYCVTVCSTCTVLLSYCPSVPT